MPVADTGLERNLTLYGRHRVSASLLFWFPTSTLYFISRVGLADALLLGSVYFLAVVLFEVPSGWMSDRVGRVLTLRLGALWWVGAYAVLPLAGSSITGSSSGAVALVLLAAGQVLVALGFAFLSGTESAFHFDTLEALGRHGDFGVREARIARNALLGTAGAAVVGGSLGLIDLRLPFVASFVAAVYQAWLAFHMTEPVGRTGTEPAGPVEAASPVRPQPETRSQLRATVAYLRGPGLAWIFLFLTLQQPLEGLAFDLVQPWLTELLGADPQDSGAAPLYSGLLVAAMSFVGSAAAARSVWLRATLGLRRSLWSLAAVEAVILVGMALVVTPWLIPLFTFRSAQAGAAPIIVANAVAPKLARIHRATFLSLGSLSGRLAYGLSLLVLRLAADLSQVLTWAAILGVASVALLGLGSSLLVEREERTAAG